MEAACGEFAKQLLVKEMNLTQVRLARVSGHARPMLNRDAVVRVSRHAVARDEFDVGKALLRKLVSRLGVYGRDARGHCLCSIQQIGRRIVTDHNAGRGDHLRRARQ